jgi:hypothetical protein
MSEMVTDLKKAEVSRVKQVLSTHSQCHLYIWYQVCRVRETEQAAMKPVTAPFEKSMVNLVFPRISSPECPFGVKCRDSEPSYVLSFCVFRKADTRNIEELSNRFD